MTPPNLPLSWIIKDNDNETYDEVIRIGRKFTWFALKAVDININWVKELNQDKNNNLLIRGVGKELKNILSSRAFSFYETGREAVIKLDAELKWKKSLIELRRRGRRSTSVYEAEYSKENIAFLNDLKQNSRHSHKPELKYLFRNSFTPSMRLFVVKDNNDRWLGAILLSKNNISKYHCELLLKRKKSQTGIMEYLITQTAQVLKKECVAEFSLGEVPFISINMKSRIINELIHLISPIIKISYNYRGLFFFKNKFSPKWEPVYLCSNKRITIPTLYYLSIRTNFLRLLLHKTFMKIKIFSI